MDPIDKKAKFNRNVGIVSLLALVCLLIYTSITYAPFTAGGAEDDTLYQLTMHAIYFVTGLATIFVIGLAIGVSSLVPRLGTTSKLSGIVLSILGIVLLNLSYMVPRGGDSVIAIQTVPVALLYIGVGTFLTLKKRK